MKHLSQSTVANGSGVCWSRSPTVRGHDREEARAREAEGTSSLLDPTQVHDRAGTVSMCAVLVNKAVLSSWEFNYPLTMIASQMVISLSLLWTLKQCGFIHYKDWSLATAKKARH